MEATLTTRMMPYLQELQKRLIAVGIVFVIAAGIGFIYYQKILMFIMGLFNLKGVTIVLTSPYQFLDLAINTALLLGLVATMPLIVYDLLIFIKPALQAKEYKLLTRLIPISFLLLIVGFSFGIWVMNFVVEIFYQTSVKFNLGNLWDISQFFSQILITALSLGLIFQFPIVLTALLRLNIIQRKMLIDSRRFIYAGCLLFAAILPPTDLLSLTLLTIPLILLFELTLILNPSHKIIKKKGGERK